MRIDDTPDPFQHERWMCIGDIVHAHQGIGVLLEEPKIMKFAGLIGVVLFESGIKKVNMSGYKWNGDKRWWSP